MTLVHLRDTLFSVGSGSGIIKHPDMTADINECLGLSFQNYPLLVLILMNGLLYVRKYSSVENPRRIKRTFNTVPKLCVIKQN